MNDRLVGGLDEVGAGCLAGSLVIAVVVFPDNAPRMLGVKDSKQLTSVQRDKLLPAIVEQASWFGLGLASPGYINVHGLAKAWQAAAAMAVLGAPELDVLIVDGLRAVDEYTGEQLVEPKADINHWVVSAASIVAKELRDAEMSELADFYPGYDWKNNAGYGTPAHREAIEKYGLTPYHRLSFCQNAMGPPLASKFSTKKVKRRR